MAISINLTSSGCSDTAYHTTPAAPDYKAKFTLTAALQITVTYTDYEESSASSFNYDVGFVAVGANNVTVKKSGRFSFGTTASGSYGHGTVLTLTGNLSNLTLPISLYFTCAGCDDAKTDEYTPWKNDKAWIIYDARHTHIDNPDPPTVLSTTGKTITVSDGKDGIYCNTTSDGWYDTPHTFTELTQGKSYAFKCRENCPDCPDNKVYEGSAISGKTWSITGEYVTSSAKSIVFKATHVAGTNGVASDHTITYKLYTSKSTSGTLVATKTGNNGIPITFTGLEPGKTYYCYAYTTNLGGGDNDCWIKAGSTKTETTVQSNTGDVSATTLRASVSWNAGGATSVVCTIECNGQSRTLSNSGGYVGFTGLTPGVSYTASWRVVSTYNYTYIYIVINEDGEEEEKTGVATDVIETTGSLSFLTKKATFGTPINATSKIIEFKSLSNYGSDKMEQTVGSEEWYTVEQNTYVMHDNLTHNTSYTIRARILDCYAFNTSGNATSVNDSEISTTVSTKLLSLSGSISEEHQHTLVTLWQAYVDGVATNSDAIDGTAFEFTYIDTIARKNNPPYQSAEVIQGSNGNTTGDYQYDKKVYSRNLTWYYCEYIVTVSITDGYNIVANTVIAHTIFPATWIFSGSQWHRYMGHVYTNDKYVPAPVFIYNNGIYREPNGE